MCPGFASLPTDVQGLILSLVHKGNEERGGGQIRREVARTCRAFEAHAFVDARRATRLPAHASRLSSMATLPFSPCLATLGCSDPLRLNIPLVCAVLAATPCATPLLTDLTLDAYCHVASAVVAAAANLPLLTKLELRLSIDEGYEYTHHHTPKPLSQLSPLPALRDLHLDLEVIVTNSRAIGVSLGLDNLAKLRQPTLLHVSVGTLNSCTPAYATGVMLPVATALAALTSLQGLSIDRWGSIHGAAARACWHALAGALPEMRHLTHLSLDQIDLHEGNFDPACMTTLASGLPRLSSLRSLAITGQSGQLRVPELAYAHECRAASMHLAAAVGSLTRLEALALSTLYRFLNEEDCHLKFGCLTHLTSLRLTYLAPAVLPGEAPEDAAEEGNAAVAMLSGMRRLALLKLAHVGISARASMRLLSAAIPALPSLATLVLWVDGGFDIAACCALAEQIRAGRLPRLQSVLTRNSDQELTDLNIVAARHVFQICWALE